MKWTAKQKPKEGDTKSKVKFAILPVKVEDKWIWLEKYIANYEYKTFLYRHDTVVSSGIFTEKYYSDYVESIHWEIVDRKLLT